MAATPKILTPLTLGAMHLSHRAVLLAHTVPAALDRHASLRAGGVIIAAGQDWAGAAAAVHATGSHIVAALPAEGAARLAAAAMDGGCDGLELDSAGLTPARLLPILDDAIRRWGPARLAVRLPGSGQRAAFDATAGLLAILNELELGFVHLPDPPAHGEARQRLRSVFRWPIIASGALAAAEAAGLVESRWADAIGFDADGELPEALSSSKPAGRRR
ncbi:hypothetical protein G3576_29590 [Roseomonas stagni]|uniref:Uncharacterized protein n=1 Tax=Falsiroseomonas algicola TaxID=2716930 RepID=A0A6M1LUM5_9PROT|nr:hypothetical protein [Falsiroseomonas algicola]NGM24180.1 hypothetical protein [Falsiroseomonas algicola]